MSVAMSLHLDQVLVPAGRRDIDIEAVERLSESIKEIGLQHPITVRPHQAEFILVAGRHRLEAMRKLGETHIRATVADLDAIDSEMWEISENLHRCELSKLDRSENIDRWRDLSAAKVVQLAPPSGGAQPAERGLRKTAQELGIAREEVRQAEKIASIAPEAKQAARDAGLDDNATALLKAAKAPPQEQVAVIREIADRKANGLTKSRGAGMSRELASWRAAEAIARTLQQTLNREELTTFSLWLEQTTTSDILEQIGKIAGPDQDEFSHFEGEF